MLAWTRLLEASDEIHMRSQSELLCSTLLVEQRGNYAAASHVTFTPRESALSFSEYPSLHLETQPRSHSSYYYCGTTSLPDSDNNKVAKSQYAYLTPSGHHQLPCVC